MTFAPKSASLVFASVILPEIDERSGFEFALATKTVNREIMIDVIIRTMKVLVHLQNNVSKVIQALIQG